MSTTTANGKPFLMKFGSNNKPAAKATPKKRNYATLTEDDSEDDQDAPSGKIQLVHAFDQAAGGAVGAKKEEDKGPLVIAPQKNLDWREEAKKKRGGANLLPQEEQARRAGQTQTEADQVEEKAPVYGLLVTDKTQTNGDVPMTDAAEIVVENPKTADEEAIEALLGEKTSSLVIEHVDQEDTRFQARTGDLHAFKADVAARPESASLADYEAVPIEDFGLALLRGQGYKPGDPIGRRKTATAVVAQVPKQRANLLGIGAKEVPEGLEEFGAWGKGAKKRSKIDRGYNPFLRKNPETGELLSEAELKARQEQQSIVTEDSGQKSSRKHRDYDDDRYESSRHSSSRRDRSRSRDSKKRHERDHDRSRKDDDRRRRDRERDDYSDRDRRKDKERYRDDDYDRRDKKDKYREDRSSKVDSRRYRDRDDEDRRYKEKRRDDRR